MTWVRRPLGGIGWVRRPLGGIGWVRRPLGGIGWVRRPLGGIAALAVLLLAVSVLATTPCAAQSKPSDAPEPTVEARYGCPMCETVRQGQPGSCPICGMDLVSMDGESDGLPLDADGAFFDTGELTDEADDMSGVSTDKRALMPGLPDWIFFLAVVAILVISFVVFEAYGRWAGRRVRRARKPWRFDLFALPGVAAFASSKWTLRALQTAVLALFALVIFAGLGGSPYANRNIAPVLTWTIWWTWLAFVIMAAGKLWCTACPWMALADWLGSLRSVRWLRRRYGLSYRWPKALRNIWLATGLFVFLTWLELGYEVTERPRVTAMLGLFMVGSSVGTLLVFERKAFCRYACLVGRVSGLYALFSASELRARDADVCRTCSTKDCFRGNERGLPCPTFQFMGTMDVNTYCTLCTECLRTCPSDNIAWNLRKPGADLLEPRKKVRTDEAYLAVIMLAMSAFHGLTMTPSWDGLVGGVRDVLDSGWLLAFSLGMAVMLLLPVALYALTCLLMKWLARDRKHSLKRLFVEFAYSLLPVALFYHLAHNLQHIFYEGMKLVRLASDPFGWGWDLFGTAQMPIDAVISVEVGWWIQVALVMIGHIYAIFVAHKIAFRLYDDTRQATLSQVPMLVVMAVFSVQSLWLLAQPMVMRTAM